MTLNCPSESPPLTSSYRLFLRSPPHHTASATPCIASSPYLPPRLTLLSNRCFISAGLLHLTYDTVPSWSPILPAHHPFRLVTLAGLQNSFPPLPHLDLEIAGSSLASPYHTGWLSSPLRRRSPILLSDLVGSFILPALSHSLASSTPSQNSVAFHIILPPSLPTTTLHHQIHTHSTPIHTTFPSRCLCGITLTQSRTAVYQHHTHSTLHRCTNSTTLINGITTLIDTLTLLPRCPGEVVQRSEQQGAVR